MVKTFSKESATTRIQWNGKREQEELDRYRELVVVHSTDSPETSNKATQKNLHSRSPRLNNGPAGVLFSSIASSIASQDTSARSVSVYMFITKVYYLSIGGVALKCLDTWTVTLSSFFGRVFGATYF